jgi:uncharacterized protein
MSARVFRLPVLAAAVAAALLIAGYAPVSLHGQTAAPKALVVWGGWPGHEPKQTVDVFVPFLKEKGFDVEVSDTLDSYLDAAKMKSLTLVVQAVTMGKITPQQERGLLEAIRGGVGMAGWHGGMSDAFRSSPEYEFMVGGSWAAHPGGIIDYDVQITKPQDPITKGLSTFRMHSEQYYMLVDPNVEVLATTTFGGKAAPWIDGAVMPVAWKKLYGKGRVYHCALGHVAADFSVKEARLMVERGLLWAARMPGAGDDPKPTNPYAQVSHK